MLAKIRARITYANVAMTLALLLAMSGGAYAAKHYVINSLKQINPKVVKQLKGKNGRNGAPGPVGPAGPVGPTGPAGATGLTGPAGAKGDPGTPGEPGPLGPEGSPWTAGGVLPAGKSEKGDWSVIFTATEGGGLQSGSSAISFPIPLAIAPGTNITIIGPEEGEGEGHQQEPFPSGCKGNVSQPEAAPGHLCVFARIKVNAEEVSLLNPEAQAFQSAGRAGTIVRVSAKEPGTTIAYGTWAVTAEEG